MWAAKSDCEAFKKLIKTKGITTMESKIWEINMKKYKYAIAPDPPKEVGSEVRW